MADSQTTRRITPKRQMNSVINDRITVGGSPVTAALPPVGEVKTWDVHVDIRKQYIAGFPSYRLNLPQPLPLYIDQLTADFGDDLYERMMLDPVVKSSVNILKLGVLQQLPKLTPAVDKDDDRYETALGIHRFCQRALERIDLYGFLWQALDAIPYGFKVAEKVYEVADDEEIGECLTIKEIIVKPRRTVAVVVDSYLKVLGYLGVIPGQAAPILYGTILTDLEHQPNFVLAEKCTILTHDPMDRNPQGQSALRSAYNAWYLKMQDWPEILRWSAQFGTPSLYATSADGAQSQPTYNADGTPATDSNGNVIAITPEQLLVNTLTQLRNGSVAAFPFGTKIDMLQAAGGGEALIKLITELLNGEIRTAITGQTLASSEGVHMARAASGVHQDILGTYIGYNKTLVEQLVFQQVLNQLVGLNFGPKALRLVPKVSCSDTEAQDFPAKATAVAALKKAGYLDESQMPGIDSDLGLPVRAEGWQDRMKQQPGAPEGGDGEGDPNDGGEGDDEELGSKGDADFKGSFITVHGHPVYVGDKKDEGKETSSRSVGGTATPIAKIAPPHEVREPEKLTALVEAMKAHGWQGRPVLLEKVTETVPADPSKYHAALDKWDRAKEKLIDSLNDSQYESYLDDPKGFLEKRLPAKPKPPEGGKTVERYQAWTGSHRLAAAKKAGLKNIPAVVIDSDRLLKAEEKSAAHGTFMHRLSDDDDKLRALHEAGDKKAADLMREEMIANRRAESSGALFSAEYADRTVSIDLDLISFDIATAFSLRAGLAA